MKKYRILFTRILIVLGKMLPFILCSIILLEHSESLYAMYNNIRCNVNSTEILYTPMSWYLGEYAYCSLMEILLLFVISIATECCYRHRLAIYYLAFNLIQKKYIETIVMSNALIYLYLIINIMIILVVLYIGLKQPFKKIIK